MPILATLVLRIDRPSIANWPVCRRFGRETDLSSGKTAVERARKKRLKQLPLATARPPPFSPRASTTCHSQFPPTYVVVTSRLIS